MLITHPFPPVYNKYSKILILGSFPSVRSREDGFFYGHPRNRFWNVVAKVLDAPIPSNIEEKKQFLLRYGIALWDVIASCEIKNSADSSIKNAAPNDLSPIFSTANICAVYTNGKTADRLYRTYIGTNAVCLPSTSPANAVWRTEDLIGAWCCIRDQITVINSSI